MGRCEVAARSLFHFRRCGPQLDEAAAHHRIRVQRDTGPLCPPAVIVALNVRQLAPPRASQHDGGRPAHLASLELHKRAVERRDPGALQRFTSRRRPGGPDQLRKSALESRGRGLDEETAGAPAPCPREIR